MLFIPCTFPSFYLLPFPLPTDNPPCDVYFCDSVPVLIVCLVVFFYSVVDSCEFVILLFIVLIIFFVLERPFNISYNKGLVMMNSFNFIWEALYLPLHSIFLNIYLFLDRREWREKERERNISVWLSLMLPKSGTQPSTQEFTPTRNLTRQPSGSQDSTQSLSHTIQSCPPILHDSFAG